MPLPRFARLTALCLLTALAAPAAGAENLSDEDRQWLSRVAALILPTERRTYERLDQRDRAKFREIFWARRDRGRGTPRADNPFKAEYLEKVEQADTRFRGRGRDGHESDCGLVFLLLGEPTEAREAGGAGGGGGAGRGTRPGAGIGAAGDGGGGRDRARRIWIYRGEQYDGGETRVAFDGDCSLPLRGTGDFRRSLAMLAEGLVRRPALDYRTGDDGRLLSLADQLPGSNRAVELLTTPREDFPLDAEIKLMSRGAGGATDVVAMLRGDASLLSSRERDGREVVDLVLAVRAGAQAGGVPRAGTLDVTAELDGRGRFAAAMPITLAPGAYTMAFAALDEGSGLGSATHLQFEALELAGAKLAASPLILFDELSASSEPDPRDSLAALRLGSNAVGARFDNEFARGDRLEVLCLTYNAASDPSTGRSLLKATYEIHDAMGRTLMRSPEQTFETSEAAVGVGPVPLDSFTPGEYLLELTLWDQVGRAALRREASFTVVADERARARRAVR